MLHPPEHAETEYGDAPAALPLLLVGSKLDKSMKLTANRWMRIGSDHKANLLVKAKGVSREHCLLRWDSHQRLVELHDKSQTGTLVNGELVRNRRRFLQHGDHIVIEGNVEGKSQKYRFVLDLRPVDLGKGDPEQANLSNTQVSRVDVLTRKLERRSKEARNLEAVCTAEQESVLSLEREYYDLLAQRRIRYQKNQDGLRKVKESTEEREQMAKDLTESRSQKADGLRELQERNAQEVMPLTKKTAELQTQLEKLKLKKAELQRRLHPELYECIEASETEEQRSLPTAPSAAASETEEQRSLPAPASGAASEAEERSVHEDEPSPKRQKTEE
eukprot:TRINITY_DN268_c0_g1_i1.p1 TRINITY_DN268_c0_g1~~TRINITY_DN268_c0_g1_i1.p1  ORF type:complete len:332 (+),score=100.12 TRINITY_DN268_c0_g1_i1:55-1050(+)